MRRSFLIALAASGTLALVLTASVSATGKPRFRAAFSGAGIAVEQRCGTNALTVGFEVSGVATHLGDFTGTGSNCTSFTLLTEAVGIWNGVIDLEAADGSTLHLTAEGSQGTPSAGTAAFAQSLIVVSGTKRFDGASGELAMTGVIDFTEIANNVVTVEGTVSGWLSH